MALRSVQPLIANLLTDLPSISDVAAHSGLGDAIIYVDEDLSVRRWDSGSQSWTRRGGPAVGTAAILNTPIPMSFLSSPVKSTIDAITALGGPSALAIKASIGNRKPTTDITVEDGFCLLLTGEFAPAVGVEVIVKAGGEVHVL